MYHMRKGDACCICSTSSVKYIYPLKLNFLMGAYSISNAHPNLNR